MRGAKLLQIHFILSILPTIIGFNIFLFYAFIELQEKDG